MSALAAPLPVFVPGVGATPLAFAHQIEVFDGAVLRGLPGHGADAGAPLQKMHAHAEHLLDELATVPRPRVIVGHSLGAAVALQAVVGAPEAVDGLVVIASGAELPLPGGALERCADDFDAEVRRLAEQSFAAPEAESVTVRAEEIREIGQNALLADYASCADYRLTDELGSIQLPILVIAASDDLMWSVDQSEELARGLPMSQMVVVEEAGHMVQVERPHAVNLLIAGYLARLELTLGGY